MKERKIQNKLMTANRNTASLEWYYIAVCKHNQHSITLPRSCILVNNNREGEKKKKERKAFLQSATIKATTSYNNKLHMFRNKQTKLAFCCPSSQWLCLAALPIEVFTRQPCEMQNCLLPFTSVLVLGEKLSCAQLRCGYFIVMQINVTIKNIILGDVSGVITHMASSQLNSRWISPFNWVWNFSARWFMLCILSTFCWSIR